MHHAVDTNVLVVANGRETHGGTICQLAAVELLVDVRAGEWLLLDLEGDVLAEYAAHCNFAGQPGLGDEFFRWAFQNQGYLTRIELTPDDDRVYAEFPDVDELGGFDRADRKFVAVALVHGDAVVVNAVDSDYSQFAEALERAGITVVELCPDLLVGAD